MYGVDWVVAIWVERGLVFLGTFYPICIATAFEVLAFECSGCVNLLNSDILI